jgi:3-oxoacyl-[acyl-carrier-protein] synthase II
MGTAGLVDVIVAMKALQEGVIPPTVNLREADSDAEGWVFPEPRPCGSGITVSTNSGFGGINCALLLRRCER